MSLTKFFHPSSRLLNLTHQLFAMETKPFFFEHPLAVGSTPRPATVWGSPEAYYVPAIAADSIALAEVACT